MVCNEKKTYLKLCVELFQGNVCYIETRGRQTKPVRVFLFFQNRLEFVLFSSGKSKRELFFTSVSGGFFLLVSILPVYQSSPSFSLAGTSITLGLSMIRAVRCPFSTIPIIQAWYPSCFSMSLQ